MLLDRTDQAISSTELQKNTRTVLDRMADGSQDRYVVIRDNRPTAVLLSTERYEALIAELDDLRIDATARDRLQSIDREKLVSHGDMMARLGND